MTDVDLNSEYLKEYSKAFPNAEPFIFYPGGNPLEPLLEKQYGDIYFLISKPHGARPEQYFFYKGDSIYFQWQALRNLGVWSGRKYVKPYVAAYGSLDCLMFSKEERHSKWKEMVSEFFSRCRPYEKKTKYLKSLSEDVEVSANFWAVYARNENGILIEESVEEWNR